MRLAEKLDWKGLKAQLNPGAHSRYSIFYLIPKIVYHYGEGRQMH
jgi:hypothetical protein